MKKRNDLHDKKFKITNKDAQQGQPRISTNRKYRKVSHRNDGIEEYNSCTDKYNRGVQKQIRRSRRKDQ